MCGIAGIVGPGEPQALLARMLDRIAHRGPDGEGQWSAALDSGRSILLGHRRLAILDLSEAGAQPMLDQAGELVLTFNGEIYNYVEIRDELRAAGVAFRSTSDSEVILEAYRRWGAACLDRFNGMFAFALFDRRRNMLFCARDRFGEKPFLFARKPDFFAFASEYKALLQHPGLSLDYDPRRLVNAALSPGTGLDCDRQTLFADVEQLLPGEAMEVDLGTLAVRTWSYWDVTPEAPADVANEQAIFDEFRELLIDSVRIRMRSDVAVGSCLSGGLDSSAIVGIARHLLGDDAEYHSFTGRFPGTAADEWSYASLAVEQSRTVSHVVEPTVDGFLTDLPGFMWFNELPVSSSSQYAQFCVFRLAKQHGVTVLLDGQGADEMLGGYEQYFGDYVEALGECGDAERLKRELPHIRERYPLALRPPGRALRDRLPFALRHRLSSLAGIGTDLTYGLELDVAKTVRADTRRPRRAGYNALSSALVQDSFGRFLTTLLRYGDRNSMAHSREVRLPFCDHRIAGFVAGLPPHLLMGEVQTKRLLRESMRGILPEPIRTRWNKQGFRPPQDLWFKSPAMLELVRTTFDDASFRNDPSWNAPWWTRALDRVRDGQLELGWTLWQPFIIEQWKRHFLEPLRRERAESRRLAA